MWPALRRYPAHPSILDPHLLLQKGDLMPQAVVVDLKPSARVEKVLAPAQGHGKSRSGSRRRGSPPSARAATSAWAERFVDRRLEAA
jgi:hypothetical protein